MEKQIAERRLAAIMIADVAGFSRLMERDESLTFARLRKIREDITHRHVERHGGRIIKTTGDGFLAEFSSTSTALKCGIEIQRAVIASQIRYPEDDRIRFRIGLNVGDIIVDEADVAGDGVNIAARLEPLAPLDGIAISGSVREQIRDDLGLEYEDLGEREMKNISRPIRVFVIRIEGMEQEPDPASAEPSRRLADVVKDAPGPAPSDQPPLGRGPSRLPWVLAGLAVFAVLAGVIAMRGSSLSPGNVAPPAEAAKPADLASKPASEKKQPSVPPWLAALRKDLAQCAKEGGSFICAEKARWKYCSPDHWNEVEDCKVGR